MAATEAYAFLALLVVLLVVVVLLSLHFLRRYRLQRLRLLQKEDSGPARVGDRAYNRLALARKEADLLAAQGGDASRARQLIDLANRALDHREFDRAYELAQAAHETLVQARREPRTARLASAPDPLLPSTLAAPATPVPGPVATPAQPSSSAPAPLAKSRAEAQFQLRLFEEELASAGKPGAGGPALGEARELYVQAHAAFARAEYVEAFRLSLRGRRRVGAHVESLGSPAPAAGATALPATDVTVSAEAVAAEKRCPQCGYPTTAGDAYCRGCGAARTSAGCPKCGAPRLAADSFCGKCGERYLAATA